MRRVMARLGFGVVVTVLVASALFPFAWALGSSLKTGSELFEPRFWPRAPTLDNYRAIFVEQPFGVNVLNSVLVALSTVVVALVFAVPAASVLGRATFRGRHLLLAAVLAVSMFPQVAVLSGLFELLRALGLYNRLPGLTLAYLTFTLPFSTWVLTAFMQDVPREIEEAAIVDGAGPFTILVRILVPLVAPAMVTTGLLAFIAAWNEFLYALTFTLSNDRRTVPVAIALMSGASEHELPWGRVMAASVVVTVPLVVLVFVFQRRIVQGLTAGALKG
ncbi:MAG: carbohydrate ABC transporter permease [Vicinamibacterales bacterium]